MIGLFSIKALEGGIFLCSENFFQALFSQTLFFAWRGHFQDLQLNNDLADFSQIWPGSRKIYSQQNFVGEFDDYL